MSIWYAICDFIPLEMLQWDFMRNALLAILIMKKLAASRGFGIFAFYSWGAAMFLFILFLSV